MTNHINEIQYYCLEEKRLAFSQAHKIQELLKRECIHWDPENSRYVVKPIDGYNKSEYFITKDAEYPGWEQSSAERFQCTCQHYQTYKTPCAHIWALLTFMHYHQSYAEVWDAFKTVRTRV